MLASRTFQGRSVLAADPDTTLGRWLASTKQSATLANLSPNDQRHITTRTGSSSPDRFGKCQTGMPRVHTSTKPSVLDPNRLSFKLTLYRLYAFCLSHKQIQFICCCFFEWGVCQKSFCKGFSIAHICHIYHI